MIPLVDFLVHRETIPLSSLAHELPQTAGFCRRLCFRVETRFDHREVNEILRHRVLFELLRDHGLVSRLAVKPQLEARLHLWIRAEDSDPRIDASVVEI